MKPGNSKASKKAAPASKTIKKAKAPVKRVTAPKAAAKTVPDSKTIKKAKAPVKRVTAPKTAAKTVPASKTIKKGKAPAKRATTPKPAQKAKAVPSAKPVNKDKSNDAGAFKREIKKLDKPATARTALVQIFDMLDQSKGYDLPDDVVASLIKALQKQLSNKDYPIVSDSVFALSSIAKVKKYAPAIIESNILTSVVPLLDSKKEEIIVPAINVFGNLAENDSDAGVKAVVDAGVLKNLQKAFALNEDIACKAIWLLHKLCDTTGDEDYFFKDIFDQGLIHNIVNHLDSPNHIARVNSLNAMHSILSFANEEQVHGIVDAGAISDLVNFFNFDDYDLSLMTMNCLTEILTKSGSRVKKVVDDIRGAGGEGMIFEMLEDEDELLRGAAEQLMEDYFNKN